MPVENCLCVWWLILLESFGRPYDIVNVIISSFMRPPEEYPTVTTCSLLLLCLSPLHLFAANVTIIFAKFDLPHNFFHYIDPVPCEEPVYSLCFLHLYSSVSYTSWLKLNWVMNLVSCVLWSHIVAICLCGEKQRNTRKSFRNVFLHSSGGHSKF